MKSKSIKNIFSDHQHGFTLIELLVIIIIMSVLCVTIIARFVQFTDTSKTAVCKANQSSLVTASILYFAEHLKAAKTIDELTSYMRGDEIPPCPLDGTYSINEDGVMICSKHGRLSD